MKTNSTLKRLLKQFGIGALIGGPIGFFSGYFGLFEKRLAIDELALTEVLNVIGNSGQVVILLLSLYLIGRLVAKIKVFEAETDDEASEELYRSLNRDSGYTSVAIAVGAVFSMFLICLNYKFTFASDGVTMDFPLWGYLGLVVFGGLQVYYPKLYNRMRGTQVPLLPTLKELKANVLQQDEAELEANYKMAFDIVMNLVGVIIPLLYLLVFVVGLVTQTNQLLAFSILAVIHLYITIMNLKMVRSFYR